MIRKAATLRVVLGLCFVTLSAILVARALGLGPDEDLARLTARSTLCEAVAVYGSQAVAKGREDVKRVAEFQAALKAVVRRNGEILSAAVRRNDGRLVCAVNDHDSLWETDLATTDPGAQMQVPIISGTTIWGTLEVRFQPLAQSGFMGFLRRPVTWFVGFVMLSSSVGFYFFLNRVLRQLDPSKVVPARVRDALDTVGSGLLILDDQERIVLANKTMAETLQSSPEALLGRRASELPWLQEEMEGSSASYPWSRAMRDDTAHRASMLRLEVQTEAEPERAFVVNSKAITGDDGRKRGILVSLEDVTHLERKKAQLSDMLNVLEQSREEIRRQNSELRVLATLDPLTGCLNRRAFYESFESEWRSAQQGRQPLACIMADVDHFKSINDTHGHQQGDVVLQQVAARLKESARDRDCVCRYGGEEFCVLLVQADLDQARRAAERLRAAIAALQPAGITVTASFGVSAVELGAADQQALLEQADKALYAAKRNGRNQVVCWDPALGDADAGGADNGAKLPDVDVAEVAALAMRSQDNVELEIPFHAVSALVAALGYRDLGTAEHSRRVADNCAAVGKGLMSARDCYVLEVAALLHDIGKIGVPDCILLKPAPLTADEWKMMGMHDRIGVEIVTSTFSSPLLADIVASHHAFFGGHGRDTSLPTGTDIPLGARILTIADAYDAMVSDRVYRKGRRHEEAFAELRRCAGTQFDPQLVERFIEVVKAQRGSRGLVSGVSKTAALSVGMQVERLAGAIDDRDIPRLAALAGRLHATATKEGLPQIAEAAAVLEASAVNESEMTEILKITTDLLDLCRDVQLAHLGNCVESLE